jgi:hypothetical protein
MAEFCAGSGYKRVSFFCPANRAPAKYKTPKRRAKKNPRRLPHPQTLVGVAFYILNAKYNKRILIRILLYLRQGCSGPEGVLFATDFYT